MSVIIEEIAEEHAEEAAFLWLLRSAAVTAPNYDLVDLAELDDRIEAHFEGLRVAGEAGWARVLAGLEHQEAGEVFAAGVLALESGDPERLATVAAVAEAVPEAAGGLVSALGWVDRTKLRGTVRDLLAADTPFMRSLGIAACAAHRTDPGAALDAAAGDPDPALRARSLRTAGMLKRIDLLPAIARAYGDEDEACRFWASWSGALMKDAAGIAKVRAFARPGSPYAALAFEVALRAMEPSAAVGWLKAIGKNPELKRLLVIGGGMVGDPVSVSWLIGQMANPEFARVAGEAVAMITGANIADDDLEGEPPEDFEAGPTEDPEDEDVEMDPDEDLPWPDAVKVEAWWGANKGRFKPGQRYLLGVPVAPAPLQQVLRTGTQRQRQSAAMEIALSAADAPLFETRAPGTRQQASLAGG